MAPSPSKTLKRKKYAVGHEALAPEKQPTKRAKKSQSKPDSNLPNSISFPRTLHKSFKKSQKDESDEESSGQDGSAQEVDRNNDHLDGFSTDYDSSDGESDDPPAEFDMGKLPTIAKDDEIVKRKLEKAKRQPTEDRGVLFIGRLPHGFFEDQLKAYFSQFGVVTRVRVSRNKKTGKSKHYAFIEFDSSAVAEIVAETMNNYLIMGHILQCKLIPKEKVHPELWVGANRKWRAVPRDRIARLQHNKSRTEEEQKRTARRLLKRQTQRKRKLAELGINYDIDAAGYKKVQQAIV